MICPHCGKETPGQDICGHCGKPSDFAVRMRFQSVGTLEHAAALPPSRPAERSGEVIVIRRPRVFLMVLFLILGMVLGWLLSGIGGKAAPQISFDLNSSAAMAEFMHGEYPPEQILPGEAVPEYHDLRLVNVQSYWSFSGWNTHADGSGIGLLPGQRFDLPVAESVTLYAQWAEQASDEIIFPDSQEERP